MPSGIGRVVLFITLVCVLLPVPGMAQSYRDAVGFPVVEVYKSMLNFAEGKQYSKINRPLEILLPITDHITRKFTDDPLPAIRKAIEKEDSVEILSSVRTLIILDIKDLLDEALQTANRSAGIAKSFTNAARLNYELLSPNVMEKDFAANQKIKRDFVDAMRLLAVESLYSGEKTDLNIKRLELQFTRIVSNLSQVYPAGVK